MDPEQLAAFAACSHDLLWLVEAPHETRMFGTDPPFRVCRGCGYAEEGWGCGYYKLAQGNYVDVPALNRGVAWKYVRKLHSQDTLNNLRFGPLNADASS